MRRTSAIAATLATLFATHALGGEPGAAPATTAPSASPPAPASSAPAVEPNTAATPDASADVPESLGRIEVTAPREIWQRSITPGANDAVDVGEALQASGETSKVRKGGFANDVVLRGFQRDNVAVLVDGARLFGACPNRMDPPAAHVDAAEVDRIEVRRGPFDVTSPGSLGGSVQVHTRAPQPGLNTTVDARYGSFDDLRSAATFSYGGDSSDAQVGASFRRADPFLAGDLVPITDIYDPASANRYRPGAADGVAYNAGGAWARVGAAPWEGHRVELSYARAMSRDVIYPFLLMDAVADDTDRVALSWAVERWGALRDGRASLNWSRVYHDMTDARRCSSSARPASCEGALQQLWSMRSVATSNTAGARVQGRLGEGESATSGTTLLGADFDLRAWNVETTRAMRSPTEIRYATEASVPDVTVLRGGIFGEHRRKLADRLTLIAGARFELSAASAAIDRTDAYRLFFPSSSLERHPVDLLPAGNARLEYQLAEPLTAFAGIGHAARAPDPQERFFALTGMGGKPGRVGRPDLVPARNTEADVGVAYRAGPARASAQLFYSRVTDFIVLANVRAADGSAATTYANTEASLYGAEASADAQLGAGFSARVGVTWSRGLDLGSGGNLPEIPPLQLTAVLRFDSQWLFVEAEEVYAARQDEVADALQEQPTAAWYVTNLSAGFTYEGLQISVGVRNLFNKQYYEHLSYLRDPFASGVRVPEPGRALFASARYLF